MTTSAYYSVLAQSIGWAVLHSLWQIGLIWLVFKAFSYLFRGKNQLIYLSGLLSMASAALWFFVTLLGEYRLLAEASRVASSANMPAFPAFENMGVVERAASVAAAPGLWESAGIWLETHADLVGWAWCACVLLLWMRLLGGWWLVERLRKKDVTLPASEWSAQCQELCNKLKINHIVILLETPHVKEPLTLGFWKPVVLFPAGMLLSLSPAQVEALLLHELAHIRRHDYLVNLFQIALETCFFYHPLFGSISRDARLRREYCCDDVVLSFTGNPLMYAQTLTNLQLSFHRPVAQFTMNATGQGRFTERIFRIAGITPQRESRPNWILAFLLPLVISIGAWWPMQAESNEKEAVGSTLVGTLDTLPPKKQEQPVKALPTAPLPALEATESEVPEGQPFRPVVVENVAMEAVKMNVFYIGVDNPLRIAATGVSSENIEVQLIGKGTIDGGNGLYNVRVTEPGSVTVRVLTKQDGNISTVTDQKYRVKRVPDLTVMFGGKRGGSISKEKLLANSKVLAVLENFDFDASCEIVGFEISILPRGQDPITYTIEGADIPEYVKAAFEKLSGNGDAVFFDEIRAKCPGDGAARHLGGLAFKLNPEGE